MSFTILYNDETAEQHSALIIQRPNIPTPEKNIEYIEIKGKNGVLTQNDGTYKDIEIEIELNYASKVKTWQEVYRELKTWFLSNGNKELKFSDDLSYFRKVRNVSIGTNERIFIKKGLLKPVFRCDPFEYLCAGKEAITNYSAIFNPYYTAAPTYKITGEGVCTITVNGKIVKANVGQNLTIDTDLMIAYRTDTKVLNNTAISGKYQDLYLLEGENRVSVTPGFKLEIIPNWRTL